MAVFFLGGLTKVGREGRVSGGVPFGMALVPALNGVARSS